MERSAEGFLEFSICMMLTSLVSDETNTSIILVCTSSNDSVCYCYLSHQTCHHTSVSESICAS